MSLKVIEFDDSLIPKFQTNPKVKNRPNLIKAKKICNDCLKKLGTDILGILLYGSVARNDSNELSDLDILMLIKNSSASFVELIKENISDEGCSVSIQIIDLKALIGSLLVRDPYILGPIQEGKILFDAIDILNALKESVERTEVIPSHFTSSFLKARSNQRISIANYKNREALHHIIASATDDGFSIAHRLGKAPRTVQEMISVLQNNSETKIIANSIDEIFKGEEYSAFSILMDKVTNIKQMTEEYYLKNENR